MRAAAHGLCGPSMQLWVTHEDPGGKRRPMWMYLPAEQREAIRNQRDNPPRTNHRIADPAPPFVVKLKLRNSADFVGLELVDPPAVTSSTASGVLRSWTSARSPGGVRFFWNREDRAVVVPGTRRELAPMIADIGAEGCGARAGTLSVGDTILLVNDKRMGADEMMQLFDDLTEDKPLVLTVRNPVDEDVPLGFDKSKPPVDWWYCADGPRLKSTSSSSLGTTTSVASRGSADELEPEGDDATLGAAQDAASTGAVHTQPCMVVAGGPQKSLMWEVRAGHRGFKGDRGDGEKKKSRNNLFAATMNDAKAAASAAANVAGAAANVAGGVAQSVSAIAPCSPNDAMARARNLGEQGAMMLGGVVPLSPKSLLGVVVPPSPKSRPAEQDPAPGSGQGT